MKGVFGVALVIMLLQPAMVGAEGHDRKTGASSSIGNDVTIVIPNHTRLDVFGPDRNLWEPLKFWWRNVDTLNTAVSNSDTKESPLPNVDVSFQNQVSSDAPTGVMYPTFESPELNREVDLMLREIEDEAQLEQDAALLRSLPSSATLLQLNRQQLLQEFARLRAGFGQSIAQRRASIDQSSRNDQTLAVSP